MDITGEKDLLQALRSADEAGERRALLEEHRELLGVGLIRALKDTVQELLLEDSRRALALAETAVEAATMMDEAEGVAWAWWARGNALVFMGRYDECLAAYATALSIFAEVDQPVAMAHLRVNSVVALLELGRYDEARAMGQVATQTMPSEAEARPAAANLYLNLGIVDLRQGRHQEALARLDRAEAIYRELGNRVQVARCRVTQAVCCQHQDRFDRAEALLKAALQVFTETGQHVPRARTALNLGHLHHDLGDYQTALRWLEMARAAFASMDNDVEVAVVDMERVRCYRALNLHREALAAGRVAVETFTRLKNPRQLARTLAELGLIHRRLGHLETAREELDRAHRLLRAEGAVVETAVVDVERADLWRRLGSAGEALSLAHSAAGVLDAARYPIRHARAQLVMAACCEDLGLIAEALAAYRAAWQSGRGHAPATAPLPSLAYSIAYGRGAMAEAAGQVRLAYGEYRRAVGYLAQVGHGLGLDEFRAGYLDDKRAVYEAALRLALEHRDLAEAFRCVEAGRSGALLDFLAGGRRPAPAGGEAGWARLEELKARWRWGIHRLEGPGEAGASDDRPPEDRPARLAALAQLERELAGAWRRARLADPRYAALSRGDVLSLAEVQRRLPPHAALIEFDHVGDQLYAFAIGRETAHVVELGSLARTRWEVLALRHSLEEVMLFEEPATREKLVADARQRLGELYTSLLAGPLGHLPPDTRRLIVVPDAVLHYLPFCALHDGRAYLVERYEVAHLPAASLLAALPAARPAAAGRPLVMGHSHGGLLPTVRDEVRLVAESLAGRCARPPLLLTGAQATAANLRRHSPEAGVLHVATHGLFRDDAPLFSALYLADGPFTVHEVYGLDLSQAALVTLSACQTGLGQTRGGELLGLTQALFHAGAPAVVVGLWRVADVATAGWMAAFYRHLAQGATVGGALRAAHLANLRRYGHPYYWAPFTAWGRAFDRIF